MMPRGNFIRAESERTRFCKTVRYHDITYCPYYNAGDWQMIRDDPTDRLFLLLHGRVHKHDTTPPGPSQSKGTSELASPAAFSILTFYLLDRQDGGGRRPGKAGPGEG